MFTPNLKIAPASVEDYRRLAEKKLPRQFFDYIDGGSYQETTLANNNRAFECVELNQKILTDVSNVNTQIELFDQQLSQPVILAPVGLTGCFAKRGEVQALKAANSHQLPYCLSTVGICSIEELKQQHMPFWFQLYVIKDREYSKKLMNRAAQAGCNTLVITVDLPVLGERYRDVRNGLSGGNSTIGKLKRTWDLISHPAWLYDVAIKGKPLVFGNLAGAVPDANSLADFKAWVDSQFDPSMTWQDINWIRDHWHGNLVIKGILSVGDANNAVKVGADAIVISNHGGRQLDSAPSTLSMLPSISKNVNGRCKLIIDGGIRSGIDVLKALAYGADACMIGRPWVYALAAQGEVGVDQLLSRFQAELKTAMALTGVSNISSISADILIKAENK